MKELNNNGCMPMLFDLTLLLTTIELSLSNH